MVEFGKINVLITAILPVRVRLLCFQHFINFCALSNALLKFSLGILWSSVQNFIPRRVNSVSPQFRFDVTFSFSFKCFLQEN